MNLSYKALRSGLVAALWKAGHAIWPVLTVYMAHSNIRGRAWPSLDTLQKETGISRETLIAAKAWLVEHEALEPVPYAQRVGPERNYPRMDVLQLTGFVKVEGGIFEYVDLPNDSSEPDEGQSSDNPTIDRAQSSDRPTINRQTDRPKTTTTAISGDGSSDPLPVTAVWEQEAKAVLSPFLAQELFDLEDTYTYSWVVDAIREAVKTQGAGGFNVKYVGTILKRWQSDGRNNETRDARAADISWQYEGMK